MLPVRVRNSLILLAATAGLAGCSTYGGPFGGVSVGTGYGYGDPYYGYGYDRYGYNRYGYGYGGYDPYYGYGYGYRPSYYGWNNGWYYPGSGYYVYDRDGRRQRWTEQQKGFWESRGPGVTVVTKENWSGYRQPATATTQTTTVNRTARVGRPSAVQQRQAVRSQRVSSRDTARETRRETRRERRERRDDD